MRSHGPGVRFHPTDEELIMYYLTRKVMRRRFHRDGIRDLNVYDFAPRDLQGQARCERDLKYYFFCPTKRKHSTGKRMNRSTNHGFWKATGEDRRVLHDGKTVGMKKSLVFHTQDPMQRTNWVMHEYKLQDEYLKQLGLEEDSFVLCEIFEKDGRGPRNGAEYGGPYRDEDWNFDNDCDPDDDDDADDGLDNRGEDPDDVGALTQVHTDKGESTVPNDFVRADGYCVGSSSRTLPSEFDQSVNNGFPPTRVLGNPLRDSHFPLSTECGMSVDEIPSFSHPNEQAQDIGVDGDINIFNDLEDLFSLDDLSNSDDYMELADVSNPFEGSHQHNHSSSGQPSPSFGPMTPEGVPVSILVGNLASGPIGFRDQYFGENVPYSNPRHQFAQGPVAFIGQSLRGNVTSLHGPQFAEDLIGLSVQGFEENESHMNQHYQTADGSIGFHGLEPSINGQVDHLSTVWAQNIPFGIMQPPQSMPRGSPHNPS